MAPNESHLMDPQRRLRVAICQPSVPHYRVPVFNALGRRNLEVTLFAGEGSKGLDFVGGNEHFQYQSAPITPCPIGPVKFVWQQANVEVVDRQRFDVAVLSWDAHYRSLGAALRKAKTLRFPLVLWGHGYSKRPSRLRDGYRNYLGRRSPAVLLYSQSIANHLIKTAGFQPNRVYVAPNALDQTPIAAAAAAWRAQPDGLAAFQTQHGLNPNQTLIFVSRLDVANRLDLALEAMSMLVRRFEALKLVVIGDGEVKTDLQRQSASLGLVDRVIWTGSMTDQMKIAPWMLSAACLVYPINMGLTVLHAMGYGLPVVTSDLLVKQGPEIDAVVDGVTGRFFHGLSAASLAESLEKMLADPESLQPMSNAARRSVETRFSLESMVDGYEASIRGAVARMG